MKILGIMGSSRRDGNTNDLLDVAFRGATEAGAEVEKIVLLDYNIHHIHNCKDCRKQGVCPPDDWPIVRDKMFDADAILWATPLYCYTVSGLLKVVLDRFSCVIYWDSGEYLLSKLKGKATGLIWTQDEAEFEKGQHLLGAMRYIYSYEFIQLVDIGYVWAVGGSRGTSLKNQKAVQEAYELGQKLARFKRA